MYQISSDLVCLCTFRLNLISLRPYCWGLLFFFWSIFNIYCNDFTFSSDFTFIILTSTLPDLPPNPFIYLFLSSKPPYLHHISPDLMFFVYFHVRSHPTLSFFRRPLSFLTSRSVLFWYPIDLQLSGNLQIDNFLIVTTPVLSDLPFSDRRCARYSTYAIFWPSLY